MDEGRPWDDVLAGAGASGPSPAPQSGEKPEWAKPAAPHVESSPGWPPRNDAAPGLRNDAALGLRNAAPPDEPRGRPIPDRWRSGRRVGALLVAAALAGFFGGRIGDGGDPAAQRRDVLPTAAPAASGAATASASDLNAIYRAVAPAVVEIRSGAGSSGVGSGFIIDVAGIIITNNHVISGANVEVTLADGRTLAGRVAGRDPQFDLAVIRLTNAPNDLVAARLGDSDLVQPGQTVAAIGAPFGFGGSMTVGVVSAVNRTFQGNSEYPPMRGLIQTDAAINPGNSGGPLINTAGEVVGVTTAIESPVRGSVGVGFAVPIKQAQASLPALVRGRTVQHPFLGIQGERSAAGGVEVVGVTPGSSADAAGIRTGDVITAINGVPVGSIEELAAQLERHGVGKRVTLIVRRGNQTISISVTLRAYQGG